MTDLTALTTQFGLLDRETQEALKAHGGPVQFLNVYGNWQTASRPDWSRNMTYRVKPMPQPRTIYLCEVHGERHVHDTAIAATREALEYQHGEATVSEFVEVLK